MKMKQFLLGLSLLLLILLGTTVTNSCCSLCKIETSTVYETDTIYSVDTTFFEILPDIEFDDGDVYITIAGMLDAADTIFSFKEEDYLDGYMSVDEVNKKLKEIMTVVLTNNKANSVTSPFIVYSDTVEASTEFAYARSFVINDNLRLELTQKDSLIVIVSDSLNIVIFNKEIIIKEKSTTTEKIEKKMKRFGIISIILGGLLLISFIVIRILFALYKR